MPKPPRAAVIQFTVALAVGYWLGGPLLVRLGWLSPAARSGLPSAQPRRSASPPASVATASEPHALLPQPAAGQAGPFDLDRRRGLRAAVAARARDNELVLFTSNAAGIPSAVNMALQLRRLSIEHHLVLAGAVRLQRAHTRRAIDAHHTRQARRELLKHNFCQWTW